jgi:hypothetical protein
VKSFRETAYHADALGKYHQGLFYSDTVFAEGFLTDDFLWIDIQSEENVRTTKISWNTPLDILYTATFFHETIHFLQDLATGFGDIYCYAM